MFKIFRPIKTLLLIIVFMTLAVVASVNFSTNEESKKEMQNGFFWQAGNKIISTIFVGLDFLSTNTLENKEVEENLKEEKKEKVLIKVWDEFKEKISLISFGGIFKKSEEINLDLSAEIKDKFFEVVDETKTIFNKNEQELFNEVEIEEN